MSNLNKHNFLRESYQPQQVVRLRPPWWERLHIDLPLFIAIMTLITMGLIVLYSADNRDAGLIGQQALRFALGLGIMLVLAQIPPRYYYAIAPWLFGVGIILLIATLLTGHIGKGAERWLNLGLFRFQPSEIMKLAMPMMLSWYLSERLLPPSLRSLAICFLCLLVPVGLIAKQPDLGTAIMIAVAGLSVLLLAGISWRLVLSLFLVGVVCTPIVWRFLHDYQKQRVLTFFDPERDPMGTGYHIIQSKIAIGSGGIFGKGYLHGTQSHLQFLPEHATDFIFAVLGEEFGFVGAIAILAVFLIIVIRCLYISSQAQDTFTRLLTGSLSLTFFFSFFVNIGMVSGILPVVGVPLPLVSYGGTSMVTILAGFGVIMSIHTHRKLLAS
ncbi:MAG: rod shape-determining protein RodA [Coxiellaceae bacterium]|nr:MAG: rod shape-determining protein RodA [Coxiellaceae bacterium]